MLLAIFIDALCLLIWMETLCRDSYSLTMIWLMERTGYAALCVGLITLVLMALAFLLDRPAPALAIGNAFFLLLGVAQHFMLDLRGDPFQSSDLKMAGEEAAVAGSLLGGGFSITQNMLRAAVLMVGVVPLVFLGVRMTCRKCTVRIGLTVVLLAACAPCLYLMAQTQADDLIVMEDDYTKRGFLVAFADRLPCFDERENVMIQPDSYGEDSVKAILAQHVRSDEAPSVLPHVLFVMSESLFDIGAELALSDEPIPFFKQLQQAHWGGDFYSITYGGGTANVEYEVLTGYRTADTPGYGFNLLDGVIREDMHTLVSVLESYGYATQAIHPNDGSFYDRKNVYTAMGFDDMWFIDEFDLRPESVLNFPPDDYLFRHIVRAYEQRPAGKPWFCHAVTYQNHAGYGFESDFSAIEVQEDLEPSALLNAHNFANMMRLSDDALRELISYFQSQSEPIVIVVWGDHAPAIHQFGMQLPDDPTAKMRYYTTPLLIYSNYGLKITDLPQQVSAYRLGACVLRALGLEADAYFNYLSDEDTPNLTLFSGLLQQDGAFIIDAECYQEEKARLELLHYDRLLGERYGEGL